MFPKPPNVLPRDHSARASWHVAGPERRYRRVVLAPSAVPQRGVFASLLDSALQAFVDDAVLSVLRVSAVEPDLDGQCLRLVVQPHRSGVYFDAAQALVRLRAAKPQLRAALASALDVESAPELLFEVRSWCE